MEVITISGKILGECEVFTDKKGYNYIRFKVQCSSLNYDKKLKINIYRCYSYNMEFKNLKEGDDVIINGDFSTNIRQDSAGKTWINQDIFVRNIEQCVLKK